MSAFAPAPAHPAADAIVAREHATFRWTAPPGARAFDLVVADDAGGTVLALDGLTSTEATAEQPLPAGALSWRVRTAGTDAWSRAVPFRAVEADEVAPAAAKTGPSRRAPARDADAPPPAPVWPTRTGALLPGGRMPDWRRIDGFEASPVRTDEPVADVPAPRPLAPLGGAVVDHHALSLRWRAVPGATSYDVEVSPDVAFAEHVLALPPVPSVEVSLGGVLPPAGAQLAWRVRARTSDGVSPWSAYGRVYVADEAAAAAYGRELAEARAAQARLDDHARATGADDLGQVPIYERDEVPDDTAGLWVVYGTVGLGVIGSVFILVASLITL